MHLPPASKAPLLATGAVPVSGSFACTVCGGIVAAPDVGDVELEAERAQWPDLDCPILPRCPGKLRLTWLN